MNRKYFLKSSLQVAFWVRLIAKFIDLFIVMILSIFFYPVGIILSLIYLGGADSLRGGQSVGKKLMGLAVISLEDGMPCSVKQSIVRNLPLLLPQVLAIFPLWGWIFSLLIGIPLVALEVYLLAKLDSGHRLGDVMADTTVHAHTPEIPEGKAKLSPWPLVKEGRRRPMGRFTYMDGFTWTGFTWKNNTR